MWLFIFRLFYYKKSRNYKIIKKFVFMLHLIAQKYVEDK